MAANTGERTLITAIIPPGTAHINGVFCMGGSAVQSDTILGVAGVTSTLLSDFNVRAAPKSGIYQAVFERLPMVDLAHPLAPSLILRAARLNCLTDAYASLWAESWRSCFAQDKSILPSCDAQSIEAQWTPRTPLRRAVDRRNTLVELDALVALMLGVDIDDLCTVYRTQFAVLYGYDHNAYTFDLNGRLVPNSVLTVWRKKGDKISKEERTATHPGSGIDYTYELPFGTLDREDDMRTAYAEFQRRLAEKTGGSA